MQVAICVSWYSTMMQISACVGMFQGKYFSVGQFQLQFQYPITGGIPRSKEANTDTCLKVSGTAAQFTTGVFIHLWTDWIQFAEKYNGLIKQLGFLARFFKSLSTTTVSMNSKCKEYSNKHVKEEALLTKCTEQFPTVDKFVVKKVHACHPSYWWESKKVTKS